MLAYCKFNGIGVIPYSPLFGGKLARPLKSDTTARETAVTAIMGGEESEADRAIIARVQEIAERRGWKMSQVALAWVLARPGVTAPIVGTTQLANLQEILGASPPLSATGVWALTRARAADAVDVELSAEEMRYLEEAYKPLAVYGHA